MSDSGHRAKRGALNVFKVITWIVYALAVAAIIVLAFAFVLLMFAAKPTAGFAEFVYRIAAEFMDLFKGMITPTKLDNGGVIAWSMLVAIAAYAVLAWLVGMALDAISRAIYKTKRPPAPQQAVQPPAAAMTPPAPASPVEPAAPAPEAPATAEPAAPASEAPADTRGPANAGGLIRWLVSPVRPASSAPFGAFDSQLLRPECR